MFNYLNNPTLFKCVTLHLSQYDAFSLQEFYFTVQEFFASWVG